MICFRLRLRRKFRSWAPDIIVIIIPLLDDAVWILLLLLCCSMFKLWCIRVPELEEDALLVCNNSGWTTSSILWGLVLYKEKDWATVVERWNPFVETAKKEKKSQFWKITYHLITLRAKRATFKNQRYLNFCAKINSRSPIFIVDYNVDFSVKIQMVVSK